MGSPVGALTTTNSRSRSDLNLWGISAILLVSATIILFTKLPFKHWGNLCEGIQENEKPTQNQTKKLDRKHSRCAECS